MCTNIEKTALCDVMLDVCRRLLYRRSSAASSDSGPADIIVISPSSNYAYRWNDVVGGLRVNKARTN